MSTKYPTANSTPLLLSVSRPQTPSTPPPEILPTPRRSFSLTEIRQFYPLNTITESAHGFAIHPLSLRQGRERLIIPSDLPCPYFNHSRPADLTDTFDDSVVEALLLTLGLEEYSELYCAYCRFGNFWRDSHGQNYLRITDPRRARHIQLVGIREHIGTGWMPQSLPVEDRIDAIAKHFYTDYLPQTEELIKVWILHADFRTRPLQEECAKIYPFNLLSTDQ